jgi:radical SAM superfamily enzyme with C-terminal helix-hairpin-helix motif
MRVCIVDCYSDEPAGLGVPPYLGTVPRYVFGAAVLAGAEATYLNLDDLRAAWGERHEALNLTRASGSAIDLVEASDLVVILGGAHTPGRYLRGRPGVPREIGRVVDLARGRTLVGGPVVEGTTGGGRSLSTDREALGEPDVLIRGDPEAYVHGLLVGGGLPDPEIRRDYDELERYARAGSAVVGQVGPRPDLVCEVETSRGCTRSVTGGCSFCSECARYGLPTFREEASIVSEVDALRGEGAVNIRLGRQSCFFSYKAVGVGEAEFPVPNPGAVRRLLLGCSKLGLNSLHIDNVNPGVIAAHPAECREVAKSVVEYCTPGNVAAMGVETADPKVIRENNLKATSEECLEAIRLVNEVGSVRGWNGQPSLLPGINFVLGLPGETEETYDLNRRFLTRVMEEGLLLRRINIRKVIAVPGTPLWDRRWSRKAMARCSRAFTAWVREKVDRPLIRRTFPVGTILKGLVCEVARGRTSFCRFPGSYPVVVGINELIRSRTVLDGMVVGHGIRSLTCVRCPLDLNACSPALLAELPGIGRKRAARIFRSRPIPSRATLLEALEPDLPPPEAVELLCRAAGLPAQAADGATRGEH